VGVRLAILGSGSLARAVCDALALVSGRPVDVSLVARSEAKAVEVCRLAALRARAAGRPVRFRPVPTELADPSVLADTFSKIRPAGILACASAQSPWERMTRPSAWTALVDQAGFGLTLPLHAELALAAGRAVAQLPTGQDVATEAWFVNACFPDAVNPLLAALGVPVLAGVGNVALLALALQNTLDLPDERRLAVLAHHVHLHAPDDPADEARAWLDGTPMTDVGARLAVLRQLDRRRLNQVTGTLTARLLVDLLAGVARDTHVPGPGGRPGGYPVRLDHGTVELRLPGVVSEAEAIAANLRWALLDGATIEQNRVRFGQRAEGTLREVAPDLAAGFPLADLAEMTTRLHALRDELRQQSA
jgi:hypothetical protein